jgi:hypothetical protein
VEHRSNTHSNIIDDSGDWEGAVPDDSIGPDDSKV